MKIAHQKGIYRKIGVYHDEVNGKCYKIETKKNWGFILEDVICLTRLAFLGFFEISQNRQFCIANKVKFKNYD